MSTISRSVIVRLSFTLLLICAAASFSTAQDKNKGDADAVTRVRIEVTGGPNSTPVEMASVYVRYVIKHTLGKDEKIEMNIKTNPEGVAVASVPHRTVIVQVIADGWKPFGQNFEIANADQTIKIHLERPPKWY